MTTVYWFEYVCINVGASHYIYLLSLTISFVFLPSMIVNIYNQCSVLTFTVQCHFINRADCDEIPV
jgi:hypothetical protein